MIVRTINITRALAALLALVMLLSCSVFAAGITVSENEPADDAQYVISITENATCGVCRDTAPAEVVEAVRNGAEVTWTLNRLESYANPTGEFFPILDEEEMFPNEVDTIDLAKGAGSFKSSNVKTYVDEAGCLNVDFNIAAITSSGFPSTPHSNGGSYLDVCGRFELVGTVGETSFVFHNNIMVKPYETFHTMWEIYDELARLATLGDNDAETAKPYVSMEIMGQSNLGYDMPYLIVAKDKAAVDNWLALTARAETEPEKVKEELATLNYQVPVMYSNIHANEVAAADGVMGFAKMLVEQETLTYTQLTGMTEKGQETLAAQRQTMGLHTSKLVEDKTSFLGGILPADNVSGRNMQISGVVEGFDEYYTKADTTVVVDDLLDDVFFVLVPEENVEGRMYITRASSGGYDLNRDNSFQTQAETQNMQKLIGIFNPVTLLELHGQVESFQVEPCSPPHEPNVEYDLLSNHLMAGGEAFGAAAVANNSEYQSYVIPMRDYLYSDKDGKAEWTSPWDDMSTSYTPQFAMLQGTVAYTVELPAYSEATRTAATYGLLGLSDFIAENKASYFADQLSIYARCAANQNSDAAVRPWLVDAADTIGAEGELFRPANAGNGQFFPECYIIPVDTNNQKNLQAAYDMMDWLTRNDVKVNVATAEFTNNGTVYPAGTLIVSMYQAKRAVANGALYNGTVIRNWNSLYSEGITAFNHTRGFDMVTVTEPEAYKAIAAVMGTGYDYETALEYLSENAKSVLLGEANGDVIISNASEDAVAAVNTLLKNGETVAMITEGEYEGHFITSYAAWLTVADEYVLTGTGVIDPIVTAYVIAGAPTVYISGTANALKKSTGGYVHTSRITSSSYNYDRMAMEIMNFNTTTDAAEADAVIGATALDTGALAAVQAGTPYIGYSSSVVSTVNRNLVPVAQGRTAGMDCLGYVTYPNKTLTNATYVNEGDDILYGYGTRYFTTMPEGAVVLVQGDATKAPLEGFMNGDETSLNAFLGGVRGFSYVGADKNGNDINITLFANTMTNKAHQRDEYAYISNTIFANMLTEEAYAANLPTVTVALTGEDEVSMEQETLSYNVTVEDAHNLATATVTVAVEGLVEPIVAAAEGWFVLSATAEEAEGVTTISAILCNNAGLTCDEATAIASVMGNTTGKEGTVSVSLVDVVLSAYLGENDETYVDVALGNTSVETEIRYSIYDVNEDGVVDQLDITRAQRLFGDPTTTKADVDRDGEVTINDLILILNNYTV